MSTVVLLHGLARRAGSLGGLARALEAAGFDTWSCDYPSRRCGIAEAAAQIAERLRAELAGERLCAVTHSLGGILVRHLGAASLAWDRIVMLAPPNRGSRVAARFGDSPLFRWFYGPAGCELAEARALDPDRWPPPPAPFAVVAGTRRRALGNPTSWVSGSVFADGIDHDGTVAVEETRLEGMAAFATVDATHTFIMDDAQAQALTVSFLRDGAFAAPPA